MENYEKLELEGQEALIPDLRMEVEGRGTMAKGEYDRSKFSFRAKSDSYRCPSGWILRNTGSVETHGRIYDRYENPSACARCVVRSKCTKGTHRRVFRDRNEEVRDRMRTKLEKKRSQGRYNKRAHSAESPFGNIKWNLKFRAVMRRGLKKVRMEAALLFMLHNFMKMTIAPG